MCAMSCEELDGNVIDPYGEKVFDDLPDVALKHLLKKVEWDDLKSMEQFSPRVRKFVLENRLQLPRETVKQMTYSKSDGVLKFAYYSIRTLMDQVTVSSPDIILANFLHRYNPTNFVYRGGAEGLEVSEKWWKGIEKIMLCLSEPILDNYYSRIRRAKVLYLCYEFDVDGFNLLRNLSRMESLTYHGGMMKVDDRFLYHLSSNSALTEGIGNIELFPQGSPNVVVSNHALLYFMEKAKFSSVIHHEIGWFMVRGSQEEFVAKCIDRGLAVKVAHNGYIHLHRADRLVEFKLTFMEKEEDIVQKVIELSIQGHDETTPLQADQENEPSSSSSSANPRDVVITYD